MLARPTLRAYRPRHDHLGSRKVRSSSRPCPVGPDARLPQRDPAAGRRCCARLHSRTSSRPASDQVPSPNGPRTVWGAAAVSTVGSVTVEVDEAIASPEWQMSLETPAVFLRL